MREGTLQSVGGQQLLKGLRVRLTTFALVPALGVLIIIGASTNEAFLLPANWLTILQQSSILALLVLAESLVLISGKFDLSLESTVGLAPMIGGWLVSAAAIGGSGLLVNPYLAIGVTLLVGVVIGAFNGLLIVRLKLNAFIVTLSLLILLRGMTLGLSSGKTLYDLPPEFTYLGSAVWFGVPASIWICALLFSLGWFFMRYHRYGRALYAIGGNAEAARAAGIRVERVSFVVFVIASLLASLAGLLLSGRLGAVTAQQGSNLIFTTFAAAVIGGISLNGGKGPHHRLRALIVPSARGAQKKKQQRGEGAEATPRHIAMTWAQRLKRVFLIDVTVCEHCGGAVKIIACIEDKVTVRKILAHVESATSPPGQLPPARGPPGGSSDLFGS